MGDRESTKENYETLMQRFIKNLNKKKTLSITFEMGDRKGGNLQKKRDER